MTDLTREQIEQMWSEFCDAGRPNGHSGDIELFDIDDMNDAAHTIYQASLSLIDALAEAQAAQAGVVERCAGSVKAHSETARKKLRETYDVGDADGNALWNCIVTHLDIAEEAIRSIADPTGVNLLAEFRAERDRLNDECDRHCDATQEADGLRWNAEAERDRLAAANAALEAKVAGLVEAAEDAEYDLLQWLECSKSLTAAGFNMDGTADVTAKLTAALSHIKRGKTNG